MTSKTPRKDLKAHEVKTDIKHERTCLLWDSCMASLRHVRNYQPHQEVGAYAYIRITLFVEKRVGKTKKHMQEVDTTIQHSVWIETV
jgi:hypothetical protein